MHKTRTFLEGDRAGAVKNKTKKLYYDFTVGYFFLRLDLAIFVLCFGTLIKNPAIENTRQPVVCLRAHLNGERYFIFIFNEF